MCVAVRQQSLVVHKQHIGGHGNSRVFFIHGRCGVEQLEPLAQRTVLPGRIDFHGALQQAVELTGAGHVQRAFLHAGKRFEDVLQSAPLFGRDNDYGGVIQEEQMLFYMFFGCLLACGERGVRAVEVKLVDYDDAGSIGKRYRRQDEIGTPFCVTYDFDSEVDGCVTVRDRDTMQQERIAIADLDAYFAEKFAF